MKKIEATLERLRNNGLITLPLLFNRLVQLHYLQLKIEYILLHFLKISHCSSGYSSKFQLH